MITLHRQKCESVFWVVFMPVVDACFVVSSYMWLTVCIHIHVHHFNPFELYIVMACASWYHYWRVNLWLLFLLNGKGNDLSTEYYYGDFRFRGRHPWPKRELDSSLAVMKRIDVEEQISAGFTSKRCRVYRDNLSIRHWLHPLRGFNVLLDTV